MNLYLQTTHSFNHSSFQTTESNSGNLRVKSTVKSTTKKSYLYSTPQKFTFVQLNSTTSRPIIPTSTVVNVVIEPSTTQHNLKHSTNRPIVEGANEPVLGSLWDGCKLFCFSRC